MPYISILAFITVERDGAMTISAYGLDWRRAGWAEGTSDSDVAFLILERH